MEPRELLEEAYWRLGLFPAKPSASAAQSWWERQGRSLQDDIQKYLDDTEPQPPNPPRQSP